MKYLKKKKLYELAKELLKDKKLPPMKECTYRFGRGSEWLSFTGPGNYHGYKIASQCCGKWICIEETGFADEQCETVIVHEEIYAEPVDGKYTYHTSHEYKRD